MIINKWWRLVLILQTLTGLQDRDEYKSVVLIVQTSINNILKDDGSKHLLVSN